VRRAVSAGCGPVVACLIFADQVRVVREGRTDRIESASPITTEA
jgi:hypothetical protein